ncbi:hypothetical protein [Streptomyces sp. NPDC086787]|uniref:hypothetical protein n=1 Tax=Streptomyces sp. NPDC086787 TaxID=3365759 RepID=UPI00381F7FC5
MGGVGGVGGVAPFPFYGYPNGYPNNGGNGGNGGFPRNINATPSVIAAGGRITITVDGCRGGGVAISRAFTPVSLTSINGNSDTARGVATIDSNARPGPYDISVNCGGRSLTRPDAFTVIGGVHGGFGGSIASGATKTDMAIGGGLVTAGAVGSGVFWMRRRHEKRI